MRKIIDFHTHPFCRDSQNTCMYKEALDLSGDLFVEDLKNAGISQICGSIIEFGKYHIEDGYEPLKQYNREAIELAEKLKGFYIPGIHVHPAFIKESCDEIEYAHSKGVKLIGELVPYMHGWSDYSCKEFSEILDVAESFGMVVSFHTMDLAQIEAMVAAHPNVTFVAAHPGEKVNYVKHIDIMQKYENAYLDLSGTGMFRYGMLKYGVEKVGADRIIFGTDYPICNPGMYINAVEFEHISEEAKEKIFHLNAERLLGM